MRRREQFGIRRALADRLIEGTVEVAAVPTSSPQPEADDGSWGPGPFLEGGDVFLLGRDIYVGNTGNASNSLGIEWLRRYLGSDYRVHEVRLSEKFLHLDCCLATPRPGLAIVCREAFVDGLPEFLEGWDLIDVPFDAVYQYAGAFRCWHHPLVRDSSL